MNKSKHIIFLLMGALFALFGCRPSHNHLPSPSVEGNFKETKADKKIPKEDKQPPELIEGAFNPPIEPLENPYISFFPTVGGGGSQPLDSDHDGIANRKDNCPTIPNADQRDADHDKIGEACDCDDRNFQEGKIKGSARYVDPLGNDNAGTNNCLDANTPCKTIAHALKKANVGDTLILTKATYSEANLVIDKNIFIMGQGPTATIIDAQLLDRVFLVNSDVETSFCGVLITNGIREMENDKGGGILISSKAKVEISNTTLINNTAPFGGGISNEGELIVINSLLTENNADFGGGIYNNESTASIINSTLSNNEATFGGAIENNKSDLSMNESTLSSNNAIFGGGIESSDKKVSIINSTFDGNEAVFGGAIENISSEMSISNSTLSGNNAVFGGAIDNLGDALSIESSTITDNSANTAGGGIKNFGTALIYHTIFAHNTPGNDCSNNGTLLSNGFNLESATSCGFNQEGDIQNANADLLPLANNGGVTKTHALGDESDAIDAGDTNCGISNDQRGKKRPVDFLEIDPNGGLPRCDIGSFERQKLND